MTENNYHQLEKSAKNKKIIFRWILFIILGLFAIYYIAPLYVMIVTSFKTMAVSYTHLTLPTTERV